MAVPSLKYVRIIVGHNQIFEVDRVTEEEKQEYWWTKPELRQMRNDYKEEIMMEGIRQLVKTRVEQEEDDPNVIDKRCDEIMQQPPQNIAAFLESKPQPKKKGKSKALDKDKNESINSTKKKASNKTKEPAKTKSTKKKRGDDSSSSSDSDSSSSSSTSGSSNSSTSSSGSSSSSSSSSSSESEDEEKSPTQLKQVAKPQCPKPLSPKKAKKQGEKDESWLEEMMEIKAPVADSTSIGEKNDYRSQLHQNDEATPPTVGSESDSSDSVSISDSDDETEPKRRSRSLRNATNTSMPSKTPSKVKNTISSDRSPEYQSSVSPADAISHKGTTSHKPTSSPQPSFRASFPAPTSPVPSSPMKLHGRSPLKNSPNSGASTLQSSPLLLSESPPPFREAANDNEEGGISGHNDCGSDDCDDENDNSECPLCLGLVESSQERKLRLLKDQLCKGCRDHHWSNNGEASTLKKSINDRRKHSNGRVDLYCKNFTPRELSPKREERVNRSPVRETFDRAKDVVVSTKRDTDKNAPSEGGTMQNESKSPRPQRLRSKASRSRTQSSRYASLSSKVSPLVARNRSFPRKMDQSPDPLSRFVEKKDLGLRTRSRSPTSNRGSGHDNPEEKKPLRSGRRGGSSRQKASDSLTTDLKAVLPEKSPVKNQETCNTRIMRRSNSMPRDFNTESQQSNGEYTSATEDTTTKVRRRPRSDATGTRVMRRSNSLPKGLSSPTGNLETPKRKKGTRRGKPATQSAGDQIGELPLNNTPRKSVSSSSVKIDKEKIKERLATRRRTLQHQQRTKMPGSSPGKYSSGLSPGTYSGEGGLSSFLKHDEASQQKETASDDNTIQTAPL